MKKTSNQSQILNVLLATTILCFQINLAFADDSPDAVTIATQFSEALDSGNEQAVRSLLAEDVLIYEGGGVEASLEEYASHHMAADIGFLSGLQRDLISQTVFDHGDTAVVGTLTRLHGTFREQPIDSKSTETLLLKRGSDGWKIIHIHWSSR